MFCHDKSNIIVWEKINSRYTHPSLCWISGQIDRSLTIIITCRKDFSSRDRRLSYCYREKNKKEVQKWQYCQK
jgi:hypothetical protein